MSTPSYDDNQLACTLRVCQRCARPFFTRVVAALFVCVRCLEGKS